jgi:hypothetical protein
MTHFDAFNGDADGICALQQLRLCDPLDSVLVTGVKRDIQLLERVNAEKGDRVTALDISLDKNRAGLTALLENEVDVTYFDHHFAGDIPQSPYLQAHIDTTPDTCTSLLVDKYLDGQQRLWAVVGAFGDNFDDSARRVAGSLELSEDQLASLRQLGILINYNAYGMTLDELHFHPDKLFQELHPFKNPLDFISESPSFVKLRDGYEDDIAKANALKPEMQTEKQAVYILPAESWASRVSGVFGNLLASNAPQRAHAMLTQLESGGFRVSVRAPLSVKEGADELCRQFETGGGRKAAAGINLLPSEDYGRFVETFTRAFA